LIRSPEAQDDIGCTCLPPAANRKAGAEDEPFRGGRILVPDPAIGFARADRYARVVDEDRAVEGVRVDLKHQEVQTRGLDIKVAVIKDELARSCAGRGAPEVNDGTSGWRSAGENKGARVE